MTTPDDPQPIGPVIEQEAARVFLRWYETSALRTATINGDLPDVGYLALGLCGEAGEVANLVKKSIRHGFPIDRDRLRDELGDVLWYMTILGFACGIRLDQIAVQNVEKLKARYPDGFKARGPSPTKTTS